MSDIELYIMRFSPEVQRRLYAIRAIGLEIFPEATEKLDHAVPSFMIDGKGITDYAGRRAGGKGIFYYAAYKDHISVSLVNSHVAYLVIDIIKNSYPDYKYTKTAVKLSHDEELPLDFIREICKLLTLLTGKEA